MKSLAKRPRKSSFFRKKLTLASPAKVNLFFQILQKRRDGYHDITSLFHTVNWGDLISFDTEVDKDDFVILSEEAQLGPSNLVLQALDLFRKETQILSPIAITLQKQIPLEAGLGGGSSNAATTLWALNELAGYPFTLPELQKLGEKLGADIPFFFSNGGSICEGKGEVLTPLQKDLHLEFWIVKPPFGISTQEVFRRVQLEEKTLSLAEKLQASPFFNDLEKVAFVIKPELSLLKERLLLNAKHVVMTGSGSALLVFSKQKPFCPGLFCQKVATCTRAENDWYFF